jgi:hypothetical protein
MNKLFLISFYVAMSLFSCGKQVEKFKTIDVTFYYINETSETVTISGFCGFDEFKNLQSQSIDILPGNTLVLHQKERMYTIPPNPSVEKITLYTGGDCKVTYNNESCSGILDDFGNILHYEDRKEVSPLVFEFTFRFTEEKKAQAEPCN